MRAALDDGRGDGAIGDVSQRLGGEDHRNILLAEHFQPFTDAGGEKRIVEKHPGLVEDQQRRPPVKAFFEPVEQIGQHRQDDACLVHQFFGLEALHIRQRQPVIRGIEQTPERTVERIRLQRRLDRVGLQQHCEPGERAFRRWRGGEVRER